MTDLHSATRARIVEIAIKALKGCHLYGGHFGDTPAGMVADALMRNLPELRAGMRLAAEPVELDPNWLSQDFARAEEGTSEEGTRHWSDEPSEPGVRSAQDYRDAVIDDGGYVTWPRKGEPS